MQSDQLQCVNYHKTICTLKFIEVTKDMQFLCFGSKYMYMYASCCLKCTVLSLFSSLLCTGDFWHSPCVISHVASKMKVEKQLT